MKQRFRVLVALFVIIVLAGAVFAVEAWRGSSTAADIDISLEAGDVPIYQDGKILAGFNSADLEGLNQVSFIDEEDEKNQEGWLLRDILAQYLKINKFNDDVKIIIVSSSREKEITLFWSEVKDQENMVMFDVSGRGTLKLVSKLPQLDVRDEWVQDVDKIEIITP